MLTLLRTEKIERMLRSYRRIATRTEDECIICGRWIEAGNEYDAEVWVHKKYSCDCSGRRKEISSRILVTKVHTYCPDDWLREEEEKDMEYDRLSKETDQESTPQAAAA